MAKILKFKHSLKYYLQLIDKRKNAGDLWGVLEGVKSAMANTKTKSSLGKLNILLAETFFEMKQFDQSLFYFFKTIKIPQLKAASFFGVGKNLAQQDDFSLALDYFEKALDFDLFDEFSKPVLAWTNFIKTKMENPDFEEKNLLKKAEILIFQKNFFQAKKILYGLSLNEKTLNLLSLASFFENDFFSAKKFAKMALEKNAENVASKIILFWCYKKSNSVSAQKILNNLKNFKTENPKHLEKLGMFFARQKNFSLAKMFFEKMIKFDEFNPKSHLFCALSCSNLKDRQNAIFHLQNARWLDFENPIYDMFLGLFNDDKILEISKALPKEVEKQKLENLMEIFFGGKFCACLKTSHTLLKDAEWCFSLNFPDVSNIASRAICGCQSPKTKALAEKLLLLKMPAKQKFMILKNALLSKNFLKFNLTSNNRYSSFCLAKNELEKFGKLKKGVAKAISFSECFFSEFALLKKIFKRAKQNTNNQFLINQKSSFVACFLLYPWPEVFLSACKFFEVDKNMITSITNTQKKAEKL